MSILLILSKSIAFSSIFPLLLTRRKSRERAGVRQRAVASIFHLPSSISPCVLPHALCPVHLNIPWLLDLLSREILNKLLMHKLGGYDPHQGHILPLTGKKPLLPISFFNQF